MRTYAQQTQRAGLGDDASMGSDTAFGNRALPARRKTAGAVSGAREAVQLCEVET